MTKTNKFFTGFLALFYYGFILICPGCAPVVEVGKTVWGSSTRALEKARVNAINKTYWCDLDQCFEAVKSLDQKTELLLPQTEKFFTVFKEDPAKKYLVVMGIKGNVDTTEVGIFFVPDSKSGTTLIEISSLSTSAKEKTAKAIFAELDQKYQF